MRHWTVEERSKQSQLIQSWKLWDKSTGARTPEGKAISSRNAYKGGSRLFMRAILVLTLLRATFYKIEKNKPIKHLEKEKIVFSFMFRKE